MAEGQSGNAFRRDWSVQRLAVCRSGGVPDLDYAFVTAGDQLPPVGVECQAEDSAPMAREREQVPTRGRIPEYDGVIVAGRCKATAVAAECDLIHAVSVPRKLLERLPIRCVVEPHYSIVAAGSDIFPSGLKPANISGAC